MKGKRELNLCSARSMDSSSLAVCFLLFLCVQRPVRTSLYTAGLSFHSNERKSNRCQEPVFFLESHASSPMIDSKRKTSGSLGTQPAGGNKESCRPETFSFFLSRLLSIFSVARQGKERENLTGGALIIQPLDLLSSCGRLVMAPRNPPVVLQDLARLLPPVDRDGLLSIE